MLYTHGTYSSAEQNVLVLARQIGIIFLTKTTAAQNEAALSYRSVRRLYFLAVVFVRSIV